MNNQPSDYPFTSGTHISHQNPYPPVSISSFHMTYVICHMAYVICHMAHGIWHMAYGTWHMAHGIWHMPCGIWQWHSAAAYVAAVLCVSDTFTKPMMSQSVPLFIVSNINSSIYIAVAEEAISVRPTSLHGILIDYR